MSDGRWFYRNNVGEWTNYTTCSRVSTYIVKEHVHVALYALSVVALTPAIIIFFSYKVLRVPRIAIHKNLFASLLLHCLSMITFKSVVLLPYIEQTAKQSNHSSLLEENTFECRLLLMLTKYFRLTNYTWMFCEGYYLHRLLANTFEEERSLTFILSVGWGLPLVPCLLYGLLRLTIEDSECWALPASDAWVEWIYMGPGLGCILANFVFFVNIFRILVTKLRAPHANEPAHFRKAVRATVVLLPLFGLHWLLTLYRPQSGHCVWLTFYKYVNVVLDGLQGLMVAIAFCYRNGEIRNLMRQSWKRFRDYVYPGGVGESGGGQFPMSEFNTRRNSETFITQVPTVKHETGTSPTSTRRCSPSLRTLTPSSKSDESLTSQNKQPAVSTTYKCERHYVEL